MEHKQTLDLTEAQLKIVENLLTQLLPGATAWAYGSRVKGTARRNSDLDLVVFTNQNLRAKVAQLQECFDDSDLPFPVDLHVWDEIPLDFQRQIDLQKLPLLLKTNEEA
jgi:uncharacterized protein